jgi:hypothetical protein
MLHSKQFYQNAKEEMLITIGFVFCKIKHVNEMRMYYVQASMVSGDDSAAYPEPQGRGTFKPKIRCL